MVRKVADEGASPESDDSDDGNDEEVGRRAALIACSVVAAAAVALGVLVIGAIVVFVAGRDVKPARTPDDRRVVIVNECDVPVRIGWVLSDTTVPFTGSDASRFFPPIETQFSGSPAAITNPTSPVSPGSTVQIGVGRVETGAQERILLIEKMSQGPPTISTWQFTPVKLDLWPSAPRLKLEGGGCSPTGLSPLQLQ